MKWPLEAIYDTALDDFIDLINGGRKTKAITSVDGLRRAGLL